MPSFDKKTKNWIATVSVGGKLIRKRGFTSKENAKLFEAQIRYKAELKLLEIDSPDEVEVKKIFQQFLGDSKLHKKKGAYERDLCSLHAWEAFFDKEFVKFASEIEQKHVDKFIKERTFFVTKRTINIDIATVRRAFDFSVRTGIVTKNPFTKVRQFKLPRPGVPRYLGKEELKIIEEISKARHQNTYRAIAVLARTGLRSSELCGLEVGDVDLLRRRITLRAEKTKAGRQRIVPLPQVAVEILDGLVAAAIKEGRAYVFTNEDGGRQEQRNLGRRFATVLREAAKKGVNVDGVTIHTLRKTYISHLIMAGEDAHKVMAIVGHQEYSTIKRYLALSSEYLSNVRDLPY